MGKKIELITMVNLQFFAEKAETNEPELKNYDLLRNEYLNGLVEDEVGRAEILELIHLIDEAEGKETDENVQEIEQKLGESFIPENKKAIFTKKIRVLRNRVERHLTEQLGEIVRALRLKENLSLRELESITGVTASYINRIESGYKTAPSVAVIKQLSEGLKYDLFQIYKTERKPAADLSSYLLKGDYTINKDVKPTIQQKEALYNIFNIIQEREFTKTQAMDVMELLTEIQKLKSIELD